MIGPVESEWRPQAIIHWSINGIIMVIDIKIFPIIFFQDQLWKIPNFWPLYEPSNDDSSDRVIIQRGFR